MQTENLVQQLMALPLPDRVTVAQALWQSIDDDLAADAADGHEETIRTALQRDAELAAGSAAGRTHEQVMEAVRQALECG